MRRILVIQLNRTGDLIQTTPLVGDLVTEDPEIQVDLLVLSGNEEVVRGLSGVDRVLTVGEQEVLRMNHELTGEDPSLVGSNLSRRWLQESGLGDYDEILDVSTQWLGYWVARELKAPTKAGGVLTRSNELLFDGDWPTYQAALLDFREWNRVNLVDLFRGYSCSSRTPGAGFRPYLARDPHWVHGLGNSGRGFIGINPGASESQRRYPVEGFVAIIQGCLRLGYCPLLVGAPMDRPICEEIADGIGGQIPNLAGRTRIPEMAQLLSGLAALVSNDTGAIHMAAAVGTPVVTLSGPASTTGVSAFVHETGPWGEGHVVLQAPLSQPGHLLEVITPALVLDTLQWRLGRIPADALRIHLESAPRVEAWHGERITDPSDSLGGIRYAPLLPSRPSTRNEDASRLRTFFARNLARGTQEKVSHAAATDRLLAPGEDSSLTSLGSALESAASRARRLHQLAVSDPESTILRTSTSQLQDQIQRALDSVPGDSMVGPVAAFVRWKLKMTSAGGGLSGVLGHQRRVLERAGDWIRMMTGKGIPG